MTLLERAMLRWKNDEPLPLDLHFALAAEGIDVEAAEASYHLYESQLNGDIPYGN